MTLKNLLTTYQVSNNPEHEIKKAIKVSQNGKAPGIDGIPYKFYKI